VPRFFGGKKRKRDRGKSSGGDSAAKGGSKKQKGKAGGTCSEKADKEGQQSYRKMSDAKKKQPAAENKCLWCKETGHMARDCPKNPKNAGAAKQSN
jgi:hypothetical protein